ncbi:MAG: spore coat protein U domain-containing protein [Burkholderiaceae bacterium]|nr:spore coat protein U domain-containing protein [Burkholderiaceae bacterium]
MKMHSTKSFPAARHWTAGIGLAGILAVAGAPVLAATATGPMQVTVTVTGDCTVGASALAFPSASSAAIAAGNVDASGNVTVNCSVGSNYTVALDAGAGTGATLASRKMSAGSELLSYTVYTTTARTTVWGDGTGGSATASGVGTGADQSITAYGRIFSGQTVPAASYSDTVNVTISY